jgi:hypothetical protein
VNIEYWKRFYTSNHTSNPSSFAKWVIKHPILNEVQTLVDLCCGNGRDSYFLGKKFSVLGVDQAVKPNDSKTTIFFQEDISNYIENNSCPDAVYIRFGLHAIEEETEELILNWCSGILLIETRSVHDVPDNKDHLRRLTDGTALLRKLIDRDYEIIHYSESRNVAKFRGEDPLIIRLIARSPLCKRELNCEDSICDPMIIPYSL